MTEDTAKAQKPRDAGQRDGDVGQCGELGDQDAHNGAEQAQRDARGDQQQVLHGDNSFLSLNDVSFLPFMSLLYAKGR